MGRLLLMADTRQDFQKYYIKIPIWTLLNMHQWVFVYIILYGQVGAYFILIPVKSRNG